MENTQTNNAPAVKLDTNRGFWKFLLLSIITLGIYGIVVMTKIGNDVNTVASSHDGKKTMNYCLVVFVFSWLTLGIVPLIWSHRISNRIGAELTRRGVANDFSAKTFWLWGILGALIIVGPFIYTSKLLKSMNALCENYNING